MFPVTENLLFMTEKMHNKGGRPPKPAQERRTHLVAIKLSEKEYKVLQEKSACAQTKPSEFVREAALSGIVMSRVTKDEIDIVRNLGIQLRNIGTNVNTLARKANMGETADYRSAMSRVLSGLWDLYKTMIAKLN